MCKAVRHKLGFTRKKSLYAVERDRPEVKEERELWKECRSHFDPDQLVFIDESGVNIDMTRLYGRSIGNVRISDSVPINTPKRTGIVGAMRFDGTIRYRSFEGSITGKRFSIRSVEIGMRNFNSQHLIQLCLCIYRHTVLT